MPPRSCSTTSGRTCCRICPTSAKALSDCGVPDDHKASVLLVQIRNELRSLSTGLGQVVLRDGLPAALRELVDGSAISADSNVSPVTLSQHHELVLFMVASEAVANAGRAQCGQITS